MLYFEWLCNRIMDSIHLGRYFAFLLHLHSVEFFAKEELEMDLRRIADGLELRNTFYHETEMIPDIACDACSVLEMLVALACRCELIMTNNEDDTTPLYFWQMITNLFGNAYPDDIHYNKRTEYAVDHLLMMFLNREYDSDGENGNIFILPDCNCDLADVDIWTQAMWWLTEMNKEDLSI